MKTRDEIISSLDHITAIPASITKIQRMLGQKEIDFQELARLIEYDPNLTANVLRLSNSAYFGFKYEVNTVHQALIRIGTNKIYDIVIAAAVSPVMNKPLKGYDLPKGKLWEHSVGVALASEILSEELDISVPDYTFTAALLVDIGKIALGTFIEIDAKPIMRLAYEQQIPFDIAERRILGIDHAEVGAILLEKWHLPKEIINIERWHHQPDRTEEDRMVVDIVHIADILTMIAGIGGGQDGLNYRPSKKVSERLGLTTKIHERVINKLISKIQQVYDMLTLN